MTEINGATILGRSPVDNEVSASEHRCGPSPDIEPASPVSARQWESRPHVLEESMISARRRRRRSLLIECAIAAACATIVTAGLVILVGSVTDLWLPLDASRYVAEAEWLRNRSDVLPNIHPPVFPIVVFGFDLLTDRWSAVLLAMTLGYTLYLVATYTLIRQRHAPLVAALATLLAAPTPLFAEIMGWGGGSNLMGVAAAVGALAMCERWIRSGSGAVTTGAFIGLAIAAHPIGGTIAAAFVSLRGGFELLRSRRWQWASRSVNGLVGWLLVPIGAAPMVLASAYYYLGVTSPSQVTVGAPSLPVLFDLLAWAGREHALILALQFSACVAPFVLVRARLGPAALSIATVTVLGITMLKGDPSYQSRFMYLLPVLVAILGAEVIVPGLGLLAMRLQRSRRGFSTIVVAVMVVALYQVGFNTRLTTAIDYYERVKPDDIELLEAMQLSEGTMGSSHWADSTAEPTNWFVNAAAVRPAWSPIGPWLSTIEEESEAGQTMQRYFAGQVGLENGALQVAAAGTDNGYYSLQIAVRKDGWYFPVASLDPARTRWPFPVVAARAELIDNDRLLLALTGRDPDDKISVEIELDGSNVVMTATGQTTDTDQWHLVLASPADLPWKMVRTGTESLQTRQWLGGTELVANVSSSGDDVLTRATVHASGEPLDFDAVGTGEMRLTWSGFDGLQTFGGVTSFDERTLSASLALTEIVVWRNTGLVERFRTQCFEALDSSSSMVAFRIRPDCHVDASG